ncbi:hypothetical protein HJC23_012439 [Cyclotella cryptica]|uniref:Uncharacterized protein n=1 Tax=Cyclotella cryptica TaxID=29204 RepID=A0ABD3Q326_9STRA|eukprot:CCRYP_009386-RA/>CCRYP_009386-RA protein AED:0.00 eAED:0.00 QI:224/-1/1/1/-1/1/1/1849/616
MNTIIYRRIILLFTLFHRTTRGFTPFHRRVRHHGHKPAASACCPHKQWRLHYNPNDNESPAFSDDDAPPFSALESDISRARRMEMVRRLQKTFYHDDSSSSASSKSQSSNSPPSVFSGLPCLTTHDTFQIMQDSILPGYQFVWNIHSPENCHMFHSILAKDAPWYFGCISLPPLHKNDEPQGDIEVDKVKSCRFIQRQLVDDSPLYATLLRITDHRFQDDDGSIALSVQAIDRCRVLRLSSSMPFFSADLQIWPDVELVKDHLDGALLSSASFLSTDNGGQVIGEDGDDSWSRHVNPTTVSHAALAACVAESLRCRKFEYMPIYLTEKPRRPDNTQALASNLKDSKATTKIKDKLRQHEEEKHETKYLDVVQLVSYDAFSYSSLEDASVVNARALESFWDNLKVSTQQYSTEEELFSDLVDSNFQSTTRSSNFQHQATFFPSSANSPNTYSIEAVQMIEYHLWKSLDEMMRLLSMASAAPVPLSSQLLGLMPKRNDWPPEFVLEEHAKSLSASRSSIGMMFTSPFVRVDDIVTRNDTTAINYSSLRRALRLSNVIWILLGGLAVSGADPPPPSTYEILAMESIGERLDAAKSVLDGVNGVLRKLIPQNGKDDSGSG